MATPPVRRPNYRCITMQKSPRAHRFSPDEAGLSFVEVLVTVLLLALVLGGLLPLLSGGQAGYEGTRRRQEMIQNARVALDKVVRELRAAESFKILTGSRIQFTLFWGDGTGGLPTADYALNTLTNDLEYRWKDDWDYRRRITVTAGDAVAAGYAVSLTFNHAALVTAGQSLASGNDVRIRYWNGSKMIELDRVLDPTLAWNSTSTKIWFRLQAAIGASGTNNNYYLHYGNLSAGSPPANGDNVFLDYENGSTLDGWTRRDGCSGSPAASGDGFLFTASGTQGCHRQFSKNVPHSDVEIFWGFWSSSSGASDGHQAGVSARRSNSGAGYIVALADAGNTTLRIRYWTVWSTTGGAIVSAPASVTPGTNYYGRFYLVGSSLRAKYWAVGTAEPGWMVSVTHSTVASGPHYGQVDGYAAPMTHRHRTVIIRPRVALEPTTALGPEAPGARPDPLEALAGPFRSMTVTCFDATGATIDCSPTTQVRSVQVALVVMDPTGRIPDLTVTGRAFRQSP